MATVSGKQFALTAIRRRHLGITYKGDKNSEKCDAFVERTLEAAGGPYINYEGSNTMLRKAITELCPLTEAKRQGILEPGMVLFIIKYDGGEPVKFRNDGLGNADHIGIFTGMNDPDTGEYVEVMHSSESRNGVYPSTLKNAWTHCAKYKNVSYGGMVNTDETSGGGTVIGNIMAAMTVNVGSGSTVNLRKNPSTSENIVFEHVPSGTVVQARQHNALWHYAVTPKGNKGYIMSEFLDADGASSAPDDNQGMSEGGMVMVNRDLLRAVWQELGLMLGE